MSQVILFDLDGTLTESGEGITKCVQYALEKLGIIEPDLEKLRCFIGPPLKEQFMKYANLSDQEADKAVEYYRERYTKTGIFENRLYDKIPKLLDVLKINDKILGVASSKPEIYVNQILEYFEIDQYFEAIVGSEMDGRRTDKSEVIEEALHRLHMEKERDKVLMVGDREHDVTGAKACGIQCIGVAYGYGTREELQKAGAVYIAETVDDLGILASPNDEETQEHVESVRKFRKKPKEKKHKSVQPPIHPLKEMWRTFYPILIHYGIGILVSILAVSFYYWKEGGKQVILNPLDIINKVNQSAMYQLMVTSILAGGICFFLYSKDQKKRKEGFLGKGPDFVWSPPVLWVSMIVLAVTGGQFLNDFILITGINQIFPQYSNMTDTIMQNQPMWILLLTVGILAPIAEELVFRGLVFRRMKDWMNTGIAIGFSALLFGIYHGNIVQFLFAAIMGVLLAYVYHTTGTLWASILVHMVVNMWSLVGSEWWYATWSQISGGIFIGMALEGIVALIPIYLLYITNKKRNIKLNKE